MLAIQSSASGTTQCKPNIIPCRIYYTGPTRITKRYWNPSDEKADAQIAYFRGRKLRGRTVKLPIGYKGLVLKSTKKILPQRINNAPVSQYDSEDEDNFNQEESHLSATVKVLENVATFDEISVWGHDQLPALDDPFIKNVQEWISFAEAIHGTPTYSSALSHGNSDGQNNRDK